MNVETGDKKKPLQYTWLDPTWLACVGVCVCVVSSHTRLSLARHFYLQVWGLCISACLRVDVIHTQSSNYYHVSHSCPVLFSVYPQHCVTVFFPSRSLSLSLARCVFKGQRRRGKRRGSFQQQEELKLGFALTGALCRGRTLRGGEQISRIYKRLNTKLCIYSWGEMQIQTDQSKIL